MAIIIFWFVSDFFTVYPRVVEIFFKNHILSTLLCNFVRIDFIGEFEFGCTKGFFVVNCARIRLGVSLEFSLTATSVVILRDRMNAYGSKSRHFSRGRLLNCFPGSVVESIFYLLFYFALQRTIQYKIFRTIRIRILYATGYEVHPSARFLVCSSSKTPKLFSNNINQSYTCVRAVCIIIIILLPKATESNCPYEKVCLRRRLSSCRVRSCLALLAVYDHRHPSAVVRITITIKFLILFFF